MTELQADVAKRTALAELGTCRVQNLSEFVASFGNANSICMRRDERLSWKLVSPQDKSVLLEALHFESIRFKEHTWITWRNDHCKAETKM